MQLNVIPITPYTGYTVYISARQIGDIVIINAQTGWIPISNPGIATLGWFSKTPAFYLSRECIFMNGDGRALGLGMLNIHDTQIDALPPVSWTDGAYAHILATIAFVV